MGTLEKKPGACTCTLAFTGISSSFLTFHALDVTLPNTWILDFRAVDHMIFSSHQFLSYTPCSSTRKITIADGSLTTVARQGDVLINSNLVLKNVLYVPKHFTNLVSIQKLTTDANCHVIFYPSVCEFQAQDPRRMIGRARKKDGLYYLEDLIGQTDKRSVSPISFLVKSNKDRLWLHHFHLGHLSFRVLKLLFPLLFKR